MPGFLGTERQFYERFGEPILLSRDAKSSSKEQEAGMWLGVGEGRGNGGGEGRKGKGRRGEMRGLCMCGSERGDDMVCMCT